MESSWAPSSSWPPPFQWGCSFPLAGVFPRGAPWQCYYKYFLPGPLVLTGPEVWASGSRFLASLLPILQLVVLAAEVVEGAPLARCSW